MDLYYIITFFIFGTVFGSFYNVVGDRIPNNQSILHPGSHCTKCKHNLTPIELIPIISYLIQGGKCKNCKTRIPIFMPLFELVSGLAFMFYYMKFGYSIDIIIPLTLVSMCLILVVSDFYYMIIPDEILIFFGIALFIEIFFINGVNAFLLSLLNGIIAFLAMFAIKILGDVLFKKESMGGGDIKLLFFFGLCLGWANALFSIFMGAVIALPIALLVQKVKESHILPFGPFLALGAMIILLSGFDINCLLSILTN
ncbi:MAG TPA: prepilin peptidase [Bacilli bacterium]|nr:prepilin peptidase [Bacilli bacterium]